MILTPHPKGEVNIYNNSIDFLDEFRYTFKIIIEIYFDSQKNNKTLIIRRSIKLSCQLNHTDFVKFCQEMVNGLGAIKSAEEMATILNAIYLF